MAGEPLDLDAIRARRRRVEGWLDTEPDGGSGRNEARELVEDDVPALLTEVDRLRTELSWWESGQCRKGMPVVESVPDGVTYAAALVRAIEAARSWRRRCHVDYERGEWSTTRPEELDLIAAVDAAYPPGEAADD